MCLRTVFMKKHLRSTASNEEIVAAQVLAALSKFTDRCEKVKI